MIRRRLVAIGVLAVLGAFPSAASAAGVTFQRVTFNPTKIPADPSVSKNMVVLKFVAGATGTARFQARGFCNLDADGAHDNVVALEIGALSSPPFGKVALGDWAVVSIPSSVATGLFQLMWSSEAYAPVTSGKSYTYVVRARHGATTPALTTCTGALSVEIH